MRNSPAPLQKLGSSHGSNLREAHHGLPHVGCERRRMGCLFRVRCVRWHNINICEIDKLREQAHDVPRLVPNRPCRVEPLPAVGDTHWQNRGGVNEGTAAVMQQLFAVRCHALRCYRNHRPTWVREPARQRSPFFFLSQAYSAKQICLWYARCPRNPDPEPR